MVKTYDCTDGGAQFCQGCYTMTESKDYKGFPDGQGEWVSLEDYEKLEQIANDLRASLVAECHTHNFMPDSAAERVKAFDDLSSPAQRVSKP